jgi:crossover junction endodeoxyribonuclease RuvC
MTIAAFDPELSGAVAFLSEAGELIDCQDLPVIGEGTQRRIDAANLAAIIRSHNPTKAIIEQVSAMPGNGVSGMFRFGQSVGTIAGVVGALGLPVAWVSPSKWKREAGLDATAERSRAKAIETWPDKAALFARVKDHNRAEAALLALWSIGAKR